MSLAGATVSITEPNHLHAVGLAWPTFSLAVDVCWLGLNVLEC